MHLIHKRTWAAILLVAATGIMLGQTAGGTAPAAANPPPTRLAVVNVVELFDTLLEKTAADAEIDKMKRDLEDQSRKLQQQLEDMQKGLSAFKVGTEDYRRAQDDLIKKSMEVQAFGNFAQQKLFLELRIRTADIYRKINEAVAKYSAANGIALVFVADNSNVDNARTQEQLQAMVTVRKVLYFHKDFDITEKIRTAMNTQFSLGGGGTSTRPAP